MDVVALSRVSKPVIEGGYGSYTLGQLMDVVALSRVV